MGKIEGSCASLYFFMKPISNNPKILQLISKGQLVEALVEVDLLIKKKPQDHDLRGLKGEIFLRLGRHEEGLTELALAVEKDDKNIVHLINFSVALIRNNLINDAKSILEYVLELDPKNYDAHINLCNVYQSMGKSEESLKLSIRAVEIRPNSVVAFNNMGTAFGDLEMIEEAKNSFAIARDLDPTYLVSSINLGQIEIKTGNYEGAIHIFEELLAQNKKLSNQEAELIKYYLSYCYLYEGTLAKGWEFYEFGNNPLLPVAALRTRRKFLQPQWNGEKFHSGKLLIWREQGLGDEIEFSTCLKDLESFNMEIILECDARLVNIYKRTFPSFTVRPESIKEDYFPTHSDFDFQCAIGSLPKLFRNQIEDFTKYKFEFNISSDRREEFKNRLMNFRDKKLIGISWRSGTLQIGRNSNYSALKDWHELLTNKKYHFVNLQYSDCEAEISEIENLLNIKIIRWPDLDLKNDLEGVLGLIKNLDAVVTVGNAVSSLAGASSVNTILLSKRSWMQLGQLESYPWFACVKPIVVDNNDLIASKIHAVPETLDQMFDSFH